MSLGGVTVTGATGLIGPRLVRRLQEQGAQLTVLSREPERVRSCLDGVEAVRWDPLAEAAPAQALSGRDAVVHMAGEPVAQRWSGHVRRAIRDSRVLGTGNLVQGLRACRAPPPVLLSSSAAGYYGARNEEPLDEDASPGRDFLAGVCVEWERAAASAGGLGIRVCMLRTGVVLDAAGGALAKMLPPFRLGIGGPVASGRQFISWIHLEDLVAVALAALGDERWSGPINGTAPAPVTNREFSKALGRVLHRPAALPVPSLALRVLYGEMAQIVTTGARIVPAKALVLGYEFLHPELEEALRSALA
ncbi:MAG TPA: TIGR01777 family oxidoreductase [Solirubrobacteraceae bacterium]|nr:TIGR01777 family oxidoreductase [Solirubrobacteraceae bacterium]